MLSRTTRGLWVAMVVLGLSMPAVALAQGNGRGGRSGAVWGERIRVLKGSPARAREKIREGREHEKSLNPDEVRKRVEEAKRRRARDARKRAERRGERPATTKRTCDDPKYVRRAAMQLGKERRKHLSRIAKIKRLEALGDEMKDAGLKRKVADLRTKELLRHNRVRARLHPICDKVPAPAPDADALH